MPEATKTCPNCEGAGMLIVLDELIMSMIYCPDCRGYGRIPCVASDRSLARPSVVIPFPCQIEYLLRKPMK